MASRSILILLLLICFDRRQVHPPPLLPPLPTFPFGCHVENPSERCTWRHGLLRWPRLLGLPRPPKEAPGKASAREAGAVQRHKGYVTFLALKERGKEAKQTSCAGNPGIRLHDPGTRCNCNQPSNFGRGETWRPSGVFAFWETEEKAFYLCILFKFSGAKRRPSRILQP